MSEGRLVRVRRASSILCAGVALGCAQRHPPSGHVESQAVVARGATPPDAVRVVWTVDASFNDKSAVGIVGVDRRRQRAVLGVGGIADRAPNWHPRFALEVVDYGNGRAIDRLDATESNARFLLAFADVEMRAAFHEFVGSFESDLDRTADLASSLDERALDDWLAVSPDDRYVAYETGRRGGDDARALWVTDRKKPPARRLSSPDPASAPMFSPDGSYLAWLAEGSLMLSRSDGVPAALHFADFHDACGWARGEPRLYVVGDEPPGVARESQPTCLYEVIPRESGGAAQATHRALDCPRSLGNVGFVSSPDGTTGVVFGQVHPDQEDEGDALYSYDWIRLPSGEVLRSHRVEHAAGRPALSDGGVVWVPRHTPLQPLLVDLNDAREVDVAPPGEPWVGSAGEIHGLPALRTAEPRPTKVVWLDAKTVLALRVSPLRPYELVTVDVDALMRRAPAR